jgi:hypothetical protein
MQRSNKPSYSITSSASESTMGDGSIPRARAVLRLSTKASLVGRCSTKSPYRLQRVRLVAANCYLMRSPLQPAKKYTRAAAVIAKRNRTIARRLLNSLGRSGRGGVRSVGI